MTTWDGSPPTDNASDRSSWKKSRLCLNTEYSCFLGEDLIQDVTLYVHVQVWTPKTLLIGVCIFRNMQTMSPVVDELVYVSRYLLFGM